MNQQYNNEILNERTETDAPEVMETGNSNAIENPSAVGSVNENKNNEKGMTTLIVCLILIIVGLVGYICYDKFMNTGSNVTYNNTKEDGEDGKDEGDDNSKNVTEEIDEDSVLLEEIMQSYNGIFIKEENLYRTNKYNIVDITDDELVATAVGGAGREKIAFCVSDSEQLKDVVSFDELNGVLAKLILDRDIEYDTIKGLKQESSYPIAQYEFNDIGVILSVDGVQLVGSCGDHFKGKDYINREVVRAEKSGNNIYVYEKQAFARYGDGANENGIRIVNYYKDFMRTELVEEWLNSSEFSNMDGTALENSTPNWELYNTYKYTFRKVGEKYYFESFELIEE